MIRAAKCKITFFSLLLMIGISACSDSGTGTEEAGEPPEIPSINAAQPDFSYFEGSAQKAMDGHAFEMAQTTATTASSLFSLSQFGASYFNMAEGEEPAFENGEWVWSYSASAQGQSMEFKLTAKVNESANQISWAYFITLTGGEEQFQNYRFMEGTTNLDGNSGNWQINAFLEGETPEAVMTYEWNMDDEDNLTATFNFHDEEDFGTMAYEQDATAHTLTIEGSGNILEMYWDTEADHGYWSNDSEGEMLCWSARTQIACSDIGF